MACVTDCRRRVANSLVNVLVKNEPNTAVPIVPPIERKKLSADVATPITR